nr:MAG TPA: hypothetical protein [Caudoviricetes sp.]
MRTKQEVTKLSPFEALGYASYFYASRLGVKWSGFN